MNFNLRYFSIIFSLIFLPTVFLNISCGQKNGPSNSGTTNTYNFVYVGSLGSSTLNSYYLNSTGALILASNTISTGSGTSNISDIDFSKNGKVLYAANRASNNVSWYDINPMTAATPGAINFSSLTYAGSGASSVAVHPSGNFLYLSDSTAVSNNITFFNMSSATGVIDSASILNYTARTNPTQMAFDYLGSYLFVVNRGTSDISSYSVSATGVLNTIALSTATGTNPEDIAAHPSQRFIYTLCVGVNKIYLYSTNSGTPTALSTPFVTTGNGPKKIVITPNGNFVYVTNFTDNTISVYTVNSTTGLLSTAAGSPVVGPASAGVYAMDITNDSKYMIVTGDTDSKVYVYSIDANTGLLTQVGSGIDLTGSNPRSVKILPLTAVE